LPDLCWSKLYDRFELDKSFVSTTFSFFLTGNRFSTMSTSSPEINALLTNLGVSQRKRGEVSDDSFGPGSLVDVPMPEVSTVLNDGTSPSSSLLGVQTVFEDARRGDSPMDGPDMVRTELGSEPSRTSTLSKSVKIYQTD
jgi:hypothetical protein